MRLRRLELKNFRQHQNSTIEFGPGMTAIVGPNGSGKSTILEAITFALYGECRSTRDSLPFLWSEGDKRMSVTLEFELGGRVIQAERQKDTAYLKEVVDGETITLASQVRPVNGEVIRLLGLTYDQFVNSFCAEQKSLAFLAGKSKETHEEIARMLGFDRLKVAGDKAKNEERVQKRLAQTYEEAIASKRLKEQSLAEARTALSAKKSELEKAETELKGLIAREDEVTKGRELATQWRTLRDEAVEVRAQGTAAERASKEAQEAVSQAEARVTEREQLLPQRAEYDEALRAHQDWESKRRQDAERQEKATQAATTRELLAQRRPAEPIDLVGLESAVRTALDASNAAAKAFEEADTAYRDAQRAADATRAHSEAAAKQARVRLEHAQKLVAEGKCPECEQPIGDDFGAKLGALEGEVTVRGKAHEEARAQVEALVRRPQALVDLERKRDEARQAYADAQSAHERAKATAEAQDRQASQDALVERQVEELDRWLEAHPPAYDAAAHEAVQATLKALDPAVKRFLALEDAPARLAEAQSRLDAAQREFTSLKEKNQTLKTQMSGLAIADEAEAQRLIDAYSVWTTQRDAQAKLVETHRGDLVAREAAVSALEREVAEVEAAEEKLAASRRDQIHYEATSNQMNRLREALNAQLKPDLEARASSHLDALTDGRYPILTLNDDFQPQIQDGSHIKGVLSGGEDDVVALAMRMALSELIQERHGDPLTLLILDEVFGSLDADRRSHLLDRLSALRGRFEQVLIISHIEEINEVADRCLYVTRNPKTRSSTVSDVPPEGLFVSALEPRL